MGDTHKLCAHLRWLMECPLDFWKAFSYLHSFSKPSKQGLILLLNLLQDKTHEHCTHRHAILSHQKNQIPMFHENLFWTLTKTVNIQQKYKINKYLILSNHSLSLTLSAISRERQVGWFPLCRYHGLYWLIRGLGASINCLNCPRTTWDELRPFCNHLLMNQHKTGNSFVFSFSVNLSTVFSPQWNSLCFNTWETATSDFRRHQQSNQAW